MISHSRESLTSTFSGYSSAGEDYDAVPISGDIQFSILYDCRHESLTVDIRGCRNLAVVDTKHQRSDPYVKCRLLPDRTRRGKRKTSVKRGALSPSFNESLRFQGLSLSQLSNRTLSVTVWHRGRFGHSIFLGEVVMVLSQYKLEQARHPASVPKWYPLMDKKASSGNPLTAYKGDLEVTLKFTPDHVGQENGTLSLHIHNAKNLQAVKAGGYSDPFCKCYLLPDRSKESKRKTSTVKRSCNPTWNETFTYDNMTITELESRSLEITLWDYDRFSTNEFLGGVRLNMSNGTFEWMDARADEREVWRRIFQYPNRSVQISLPLRANMSSLSKV